MEDYMWSNYHYHEHSHSHVPAFGRWDYGDELPYTQCFEGANRQGGLVRYDSYSHDVDRDLYVAGDLYQNDFVTPAVIVVPRPRRKGGRYGYPNVKEEKKEKENKEWGYSYDFKEPPSPVVSPPSNNALKSKAVDEDLYRIPPEFLHVKPKRKRGFGLFSSCLLPTCV